MSEIRTIDKVCLIIDTCVWLNMGKTSKELIDKLNYVMYENKVFLLIPEQIKTEWNRHKHSKIVTDIENNIKGSIKNSKKILDHVSNDDEARVFLEIIKKVEDRKDSIIQSISEESIFKIDLMMASSRHSHTILPTPTVIEQVLDWGLSQKKPFQQNKNSTGDALIILSALEYLKENQFTKAIFVTANYRDFSSPDPKIIHSDLEPLFNEVGLEYSINIAEVINEIHENALSQEIVNDMYPRYYGVNSFECPECKIDMNGYYRLGQFGLTYHYQCPQCRKLIDTGEEMDG
ncbi:PIN domain-containing protein [Fictibacillus nanhaiensis]|uniref:PIN domain-containing protein n=1 Tax=Fictibacillus nanhaiensis TaxID=742169 RepID=UPI002041C30A|nr:PIN domain-containing protein [Fictibacillus nanhaiensis]